MSGDERLASAVHEAGHAVVGRLLGLRAGPATIYDGESAAWLAEDGGVASLVAAMAGAAAERELVGTMAEDRLVSDSDRVWRLVESTGADARDAWQHARLLVRLNRAAVERVAAALLERTDLSGETIDALVWGR